MMKQAHPGQRHQGGGYVQHSQDEPDASPSSSPEPSWYALSVQETEQTLRTSPTGLSEEEAAARLRRYGPNEIARRRATSPLRLLLKQFASFFVLVLLFAAALAFAVSFTPGQGERRLTGFFILGIIGISVGLGFFEEYSAQKELEALDRLLVSKATVLRGGQPREIDSAEVVPGDVLVLGYGQRVPADARVSESHSLRADESALTGESTGVDKSPEPVPAVTPLAERTSMVYGSTYLTHGAGSAIVVRTGMATEVGQIAETLQQMAERPTPFQVEVGRMARQMTLLVGGLAVVVALILYFVLRQSLVDVGLNTLSLAVATIPESLPIVLVFALALGARQMAARKAVVRRLAVVESLGSVDTVCTDKTGTLTQNLMTVQRLVVRGQVVPAPTGAVEDPAAAQLLRVGALCNEATIQDPAAPVIMGDPVDVALVRAAIAAGIDVKTLRAQEPLVDEIPFSSERKQMTTVHRTGTGWIAFSKGAPRTVLAGCTMASRNGSPELLDEAQRQSILATSARLQDEGMYMLALAQKELASPEVTAMVEQGMAFLGLLALIDPPRPGADRAIAEAQGAGIRVIMITGDNARTAQAIAHELGIGASKEAPFRGGRAVESTELDSLSTEALCRRMADIDIVARATPLTKQRILQALQSEGHFVAMTGDGVNDATALKQADVGVAMGLRGTDIAKESAAMVLLDDNFSTIVAAIEEGRRIFDNIRKFTNYLLSTSLGEVFVVLALSIVGYFPLSATMLLWVNVVTDLVPASALANDPAVPGIMQRRPRHHNEPILNRAIYATIAGSIFRTLIAYGLLFWVGLLFGGVPYARTMLFTSIVLHAFTRVMVVRQLDNLSLWSNKTLLWSYAAAVGLQLLALYTPLRVVFGVIPLDWRAWAVMIPVVAGSSAWGVYMTRWILKLVPLWEK